MPALGGKIAIAMGAFRGLDASMALELVRDGASVSFTALVRTVSQIAIHHLPRIAGSAPLPFGVQDFQGR